MLSIKLLYCSSELKRLFGTRIGNKSFTNLRDFFKPCNESLGNRKNEILAKIAQVKKGLIYESFHNIFVESNNNK